MKYLTKEEIKKLPNGIEVYVWWPSGGAGRYKIEHVSEYSTRVVSPSQENPMYDISRKIIGPETKVKLVHEEDRKWLDVAKPEDVLVGLGAAWDEVMKKIEQETPAEQPQFEACVTGNDVYGVIRRQPNYMPILFLDNVGSSMDAAYITDALNEHAKRNQ